MTITTLMTEKHQDILDWSIMAGWRGSITQGTYIQKHDPQSIDDKDAMYIVVPPEDYYLGLKQYGSHGTVEIKDGEFDIVVYEAKKFISLLAQGNPNVLCLLWLRPEYYLMQTTAGKMIVENRSLFVGRHVYHSFIGYAHGQLHRMTHMAYEGYMGQKRRELVLRYGYDCKNGSHLIRLLRMGIEFLVSGELQVMRPDAQQLLEIKRGEWTLDRVQREADNLFKLAQEAYVRSTLPEKLDMVKINDLCVDVVKTAWKERSGNG